MMNDLPERSQFESRLPEDPTYWHGLATRIADSAEPLLRERRAADLWWQPLARWSPAIGVAAAAAAVAAIVSLPVSQAEPAPPTFEEVAGPQDPFVQAVFGTERTTTIATMLLVESGGQP